MILTGLSEIMRPEATPTAEITDKHFQRSRGGPRPPPGGGEPRLRPTERRGGSTCKKHLSNCARVSVPELLSRLHTSNRSMKCTSPSPVAALNCRSIVWYDAAGMRVHGGFN